MLLRHHATQTSPCLFLPMPRNPDVKGEPLLWSKRFMWEDFDHHQMVKSSLPALSSSRTTGSPFFLRSIIVPALHS